MSAITSSSLKIHLICTLFVLLCVALQPMSNAVCHAQTVDPPSATRLAELEKEIRDIYKVAAAKTKPDKTLILEKLIKAVNDELQAKKLNENSFAALMVALQLANETSQVAHFRSSLKTIETHFAINDEDFTQRQVKAYLNQCKKVEDFELSWPALVELALEHAELKRFDSSIEILTTLVGVKGKTDPTKKKLAILPGRVEKRKKAYALYLLASARLKKEHDNPKANFAVGYWLAVYESKWIEGGQYLIKGDQEKWKTAAKLSSAVATLVDRLAAADAWWSVWESFTSKVEDLDASARVGGHLVDLYTPLQLQVDPGLTKDLVTSRLEKVNAALEADKATLKPQAAIAKAATVINNSQADLLPREEWINALKMVRLPEDGLLGEWQLNGNVLSCQASRDATCRLPIMVRGNYDLQCSFLRKNGEGSLVIALPLESGFCTIVLCGWNGATSGLLELDGKITRDLDPKTSGAAVKPGKITNDVVHQLRVSVRQANGGANISASLNGLPFVSWQGASTRLSPWPFFNFSRPETLGVAANQGIVEWRSFEVKVIQEKTPKGVEPYSCAYRMASDWLTPITAIKDSPTSEVRRRCKEWNGKPYYFTDEPISYVKAQCLAKQLGGRLLTVSSSAENEFILDEGEGLLIWTAAQRRANDRNWVDERGRPLRYMGKSGPWMSHGERETILGIVTGRGANRGWDDVDFAHGRVYACIEWGDEYPQDASKD